MNSYRNLKMRDYVLAALLSTTLLLIPIMASQAQDASVEAEAGTTTVSPGANARASTTLNTPGSYGSDSNGATSTNTTITTTGQAPDDIGAPAR